MLIFDWHHSPTFPPLSLVRVGRAIIETIVSYCLCQRVKPFGAEPPMFATREAYAETLQAHHAVLIAAMKAKQTIDLRAADELDRAVEIFSRMYLPAPPPSL
jgi:hypothetical protein